MNIAFTYKKEIYKINDGVVKGGSKSPIFQSWIDNYEHSVSQGNWYIAAINEVTKNVANILMFSKPKPEIVTPDNDSQ